MSIPIQGVYCQVREVKTGFIFANVKASCVAKDFTSKQSKFTNTIFVVSSDPSDLGIVTAFISPPYLSLIIVSSALSCPLASWL